MAGGRQGCRQVGIISQVGGQVKSAAKEARKGRSVPRRAKGRISGLGGASLLGEKQDQLLRLCGQPK